MFLEKEEKEKKKKEKIERPTSDIEAMPTEIFTNPHAGEDWIMPDHLPTLSYGTVELPGVEVNPLPKDLPTYTPEGDTPRMF